MQAQNQISKVVRSMVRTLKTEHGLTVPYSALRAAYLQAGGIAPHALRATAKQSKPVVDPASSEQTLYLVSDDVGDLTVLAFDRHGSYPLAGALPHDSCLLELLAVGHFTSTVAASYYLEHLTKTQEFMERHFGIQVTPGMKCSQDTSSTGSHYCVLKVRVQDAAWHQALLDTASNEGILDSIAEHVGMNYRENFSAASLRRKADWTLTYMEATSFTECLVRCNALPGSRDD